MKKVISIVLAMVMLFSTGVVAFAADAEAPAGETTTVADENTEESFDFSNLPAWMIPVMLKVAKIALKLAKAFVKVGTVIGIIDTGDLVQKITDFINGLVNNPGDAEPTTAPAEIAA